MTDQQSLRSQPETDSPQPSDNRWRSEISERVAGYRHRRGRRVEGAFSMRFPFPPASAQEFVADPQAESSGADSTESNAADISVAIAIVEATPVEIQEDAPQTSLESKAETEALVEKWETAALADVEPEPEPRPAPQLAPRPPAQRKVIAFPRQATLAPEPRYRLADPVVPEQPRILDVPEELEAFPCAPLLDGLHLPAHGAQPETSADHIELPLEPASTSQRVLAGVIDCALIAVSAAIFGAVCYKMLPSMTLTKPLLLIAGAIPLLLWAAYQYMLTMYGGATVGMRVLHLRLKTFKGGAPNWRHRRSRVIGLYFSAASLMMGLLWALVDVDALCWHDRISRTYLAREEQSSEQQHDC
jgi:uncharacterized RDD family membrane protein YckC